VSTPSEPPAGEGAPAAQRLNLTLFISGASPASTVAVLRLRDLCDRHAPSGYELKIVDIYQQPEEVVSRGVLAVPTLIKELPLPVQVLIGDFTNEPRVLAGLGLTPVEATEV
jgi:circadian clock protein KaiB